MWLSQNSRIPYGAPKNACHTFAAYSCVTKVSSCVTLVDNGYDARNKACHCLAASLCRDLIGTGGIRVDNAPLQKSCVFLRGDPLRHLVQAMPSPWQCCCLSCATMQSYALRHFAMLSMLHPAASGVMPEHQEAVEEEKPLWWTILQVRSCGMACRPLFRGWWRRKLKLVASKEDFRYAWGHQHHGLKAISEDKGGSCRGAYDRRIRKSAISALPFFIWPGVSGAKVHSREDYLYARGNQHPGLKAISEEKGGSCTGAYDRRIQESAVSARSCSHELGKQ